MKINESIDVTILLVLSRIINFTKSIRNSVIIADHWSIFFGRLNGFFRFKNSHSSDCFVFRWKPTSDYRNHCAILEKTRVLCFCYRICLLGNIHNIGKLKKRQLFLWAFSIGRFFQVMNYKIKLIAPPILISAVSQSWVSWTNTPRTAKEVIYFLLVVNYSLRVTFDQLWNCHRYICLYCSCSHYISAMRI